MRQFKLKPEKSFIKVLKEPPNIQKKVNWSRRVYLSIAVLALFLFIKRIYKANMVIFANGQIELPKQTVKFPNDIKLINLRINEGSEVCTGDTLFSYQIIGDALDQARLTLQAPNTNEWVIREELSIRKKIEMNKLIIRQKKESSLYLKDLIKTKELLLLGGLHNEYEQYNALQDQLSKVLAEIDYYAREIELLDKHKRNLYAQKKLHAEYNTGQIDLYNEVKVFIAPMDGVISDIFYAVNEICYKKEEMITIHQLENASINTYFDPEEIKFLEVGDIVNIEFPDKSKTKGVISKFFVSTYAVPSEFQKKYEPTERNVVAEVVPLSKSDENLWNSYYKMEVKVQKTRYDLSI